jgi:hypothetical protein
LQADDRRVQTRNKTATFENNYLYNNYSECCFMLSLFHLIEVIKLTQIDQVTNNYELAVLFMGLLLVSLGPKVIRLVAYKVGITLYNLP